MAFAKTVFIIAITTAVITLTLTLKTNLETHQTDSENSTEFQTTDIQNSEINVKLGKRVSRFLAAQEEKQRNPRAADHCNKDNEICYVLEGKNSTCCNNKCMDLSYDRNHCGACKNKCPLTHTCCNGKCVTLHNDKSNCGGCNVKCKYDKKCFYGTCDYA